MLSIRLRRTGKKKQASFRVIAAEARSKSKAKFVEDLGWVNPHTDKFELKNDRVSYWLQHGAQPSETMASYIKKTGIEIKGRTK